MRSDADRLGDILSAISKIKQRITDDIEAFQNDEMLQVWVIHHLQVIGEAARGVSQALREEHPEVAWAAIIALRNILVHGYFGLNLQQLWMVTRKELSTLEAQIQNIRIQPPTGVRHPDE